jgi:GTP-binding protein
VNPIVALVGRPNVGKSTLFNRLVGRRTALVENVPGVTRDRNYGDARYGRRIITVVDTGGFEPDSPDRLMQQVKQQAQLAVEEAAAVVLVCDARDGATEVDRAIAELLRRSGKPVFIAANKVDGPRSEGELPLADFHALAVGEVFPVSAEHARGVGELYDAIAEAVDAPERHDEPEELEPLGEGEELPAPEPPRELRVAILGRPNVGKSTFVNALLGENRFVTSAVPGTTRDSIDSRLAYKGRTFVVTDTAGIRRKAHVAQRVEAYSVMRALKAVDDADVVVVILDALEAAVEQDARILDLVVEKGKALVVVVNKWDLATKQDATETWYRSEIHKRLPFIRFAPIIFTSAKTGAKVERVLDTAARLCEQTLARFPTPELNQLIQALQEEHPAPLARGKPVKLFYIAQIGFGPPMFSIQCGHPEAIGDAYKRFIENRFRAAFGLEVPIRFLFKERKRSRRPPPGKGRKNLKGGKR